MSQQNPTSVKHLSVSHQVVSEVAFLFTIYIVITALLILHFRAWDGEITRQVLGVCVYPAVLFGGVALAWRYVSQTLWILPIGSLVFMGLPFVVGFLGGWSLIPLGIFGVGTTIYLYISSTTKSQIIQKTLLLTGVATILAVIYFFIVNGFYVLDWRYQFGNILSDIDGYTSLIHVDTLFHSAIIQMLAKFNISSLGLDGVKEFSYHVGVHSWTAANYKIVGGNVPLLLTICQQVAFLPAFLFTTVLTVSLLASSQLSAIAACGFTFLPLWFLGSRIWEHYVNSESQTLSLVIFMAMLPVGKSWLLKADESHRWLPIHPVAVTMGVIAILACATMKVSSAAMLALFLVLCVFIPKIWQENKFNWRRILTVIGVGAIFCLCTFAWGFSQDAIEVTTFSFFAFARQYRSQFIWQIVFFIGLTISFYFLSKLQGELKQRSQLTMLTVMFLGSEIPGILLDFGGGPSANYFIETALLTTLCFSMARLGDYWQANRRNGLVAFVSPIDYSLQPVSRPLGWCLMLLIVIFAFQSGPDNHPSYQTRALSFANKLTHTLDIYSAPSVAEYAQRISQPKKLSQRLGLLISPPVINKNLLLENTVLGLVETALVKLNVTDSSKNLAIYISPQFSQFWQPQGTRSCWDHSFVIPAMTGFPLINGVRGPINNCELPKSYGMKDYSSESWNRPLSPKDICTKSTKLGFDKVLNFTEQQVQPYSCKEFDQK